MEKRSSSGMLQLVIGNSVTTTELVNQYVEQGLRMATLIKNGKMPITYVVEGNVYIQSNVGTQIWGTGAAVFGGIIVIIMAYMIIKYKKYGIALSISNIGFIALLLLMIRLVRVLLTLEGCIAIATAVLLNTVILFFFAYKLKEDMGRMDRKLVCNNILIKCVYLFIPIYILSIVFIFIANLSVQSYGLVMFWGLTISFVYNLVATKLLLINIAEK